jgi:MerR family transcriptional regulator, copper efflux regulator
MYLISRLSRLTQIPVHTIRYYESYGLIKGIKKTEVKSNNYSYYDDSVIEKLELIVEAKEIGFTLSEIKKILNAWHSKKLSVEKKTEILTAKGKEIDERIEQLKRVKKKLKSVIEEIKNETC